MDQNKQKINKFIISKNGFLKKAQKITAYYHTQYTGFQNPGNPNYLNVLKNNFKSNPQKDLDEAVKTLSKVLEEDLLLIKEELRDYGTITICVVPRAKMEDYYTENQRLFRKTIQDVIKKINNGLKQIFYIDGTNYIIRHTNTKTTHLKNAVHIYNDGDMPYPGITRDTCKILEDKIKGKNILLIDDIYTPGVNIDEDAINALLECGAATVTFYAVGRVIKGVIIEN